jgi:hypothetical protein
MTRAIHGEDQDIDRGAAPGDVGRLFLCIVVFATDRGAGLRTSNATSIDVTPEAIASVIEADSFEAIIRACSVETARQRSKHPEG